MVGQFGGEWSVDAQGQLLRGTVPLNGRNDLVDIVSAGTGGVATIFQGDQLRGAVDQTEGAAQVLWAVSDQIREAGQAIGRHVEGLAKELRAA